MTKKKDLKELVRARMKKTGESYTAARASLIGPEAKHIAPRAHWPALAGTTDKTLKKSTGRTWVEWVEVLDQARAFEWDHARIASHIGATHDGVSAWWAQGLTVGYERIHGMREVGQMSNGTFSANKSRTFPVDVRTLYQWFSDNERRARWLDDSVDGVRRPNAPKSLIVAMSDGSQASAYFTDKGAKSSVALQHQKLKSKEETAARKAFWQSHLDALADLLSEPS